MVNWPSHNPTPPSLIYPPNGVGWHLRRNLPSTQIVTAPNGREVCIGEIRGWILYTETSCNEFDPDWHYFVELDLEWLDTLGIAPVLYLRPGDAFGSPEVSLVKGEIAQRSSVRADYSEPMVSLEIDAWPRTDSPGRGQPPKPADWTFTNDCLNGAAYWPYDPRNPKPGDPPLANGQYVRIIGSLVTDHPHMMSDQAATNSVLRFGYTTTVNTLGQERADAGWRSATKWLWGEQLSGDDERHPARWNEVHSPDYIEVLLLKQPRETVRCIAIVAQNGMFAGDIEEISARIPAPTRPSRWHTVGYRKIIGSETIAATVLTDEVTVAADHLDVHVRVQGQGAMGANGKYFAIYRVGWQALMPALNGAVSSNGQAMLTAVDTDGATLARLGSATLPHWSLPWFHVQAGKAQAGAPIGIVSRAPAQFDAFVVGLDNQIHTAATGGAGWGGWWPIPGVQAVQAGQITAVSRSLNQLDIYTADSQGRVMTASWAPGAPAWSHWSHILGGLTAPGGHVACISRHTDQLDIFTVGIDGNVHTAAWAPTGIWQGWWRIGTAQAMPGAPIACVSRSIDKLDLFLADTKGRIISAAWEPGAPQWGGWWHILGGLTAPNGVVAAVSRGADLLDIFTIGIDGRVHTASWAPGTGWQGWWPIAGVQCTPGSAICALSPQRDLLNIVVSNVAGDLVTTSWSPGMSGWAQWSPLS